jgi:hypothetical protein
VHPDLYTVAAAVKEGAKVDAMKSKCLFLALRVISNFRNRAPLLGAQQT